MCGDSPRFHDDSIKLLTAARSPFPGSPCLVAASWCWRSPCARDFSRLSHGSLGRRVLAASWSWWRPCARGICRLLHRPLGHNMVEVSGRCPTLSTKGMANNFPDPRVEAQSATAIGVTVGSGWCRRLGTAKRLISDQLCRLCRPWWRSGHCACL